MYLVQLAWEPVIPVTKEALDKMNPKDEIIDVEAGARAFIGVSVASTCIVRMY